MTDKTIWVDVYKVGLEDDETKKDRSMSKVELAELVVERMDYNEMKESAIAGCLALYEQDEDKFQEDLKQETW